MESHILKEQNSMNKVQAKHKIIVAVFSACCMLATVSAFADIYSYTDSDGVTHFTNIPPRNRRGVKVVVRTKRSTPAARPMSQRTGTIERVPVPQALAARTESGDTETRRARYEQWIREAAQLYNLPVSFVHAVIRVESNYSANAVSRAGAIGLMQLMPGTAARMGVSNPYDPRQNIFGGTRYLRILANNFNGDLVLTIAAYNAGEGAVERYKGVPPFEETQRYVKRVIEWYESYGRQERQQGVQAPVARDPS